MARFRVRARTVDMLGRQQIAGIPTAISELFKNAHDAYARNVEVDYFRHDGLLVLRDDGLGMTKEDFEQRWLTLGTESKVGAQAGLAPPPKDPDQDERPILGEKGIGRLAIAIIGPQVFILTRAKRDGKPINRTVAAYIHWGVFELPSLNLEDVLIPVREFPGGTIPSRSDVRDMVAESLAALDSLENRSDERRLKAIREEMTCFDLDPAECDRDLGHPSLSDDGTGTHFYISPTDTLVQDDIDTREQINKATKFERHLLGFTNTMAPGHKRPPIIARFRDYVDEGQPNELIGERAFFTPDEYKEVDHHVTGRFDDYGQFRGTVGIYQMEPDEYVLNWSETDGLPTECGPFSFSFAYVQGATKDSLVPPQEHARMMRKLDRHGGLYIFRDGIRVQPYGDSDYDWLDIERRRTLGAGYYFYSYRRMFGAIELTRADNGNLVEKAGREGFRENRAYRQFRSILMNFFLQTAGDFFRTEGRYSDVWEEKRSELNRNEEVRQKKAKQVKVRRDELREGLTRFFGAIDERRPEVRAGSVINDIKRKAERELRKNVPQTQKAAALMRVEKGGRDVLREMRQELIVTKPRGVGLSRALNNEWAAYLSEAERLEKEVFLPAESEIETYISEAARQQKVPLNNVTRLDSAVRTGGEDAIRIVRRMKAETEETFSEISKKVRETVRDSFKAVNHVVDDVMAELEQMKRSSTDAEALADVRERLIAKINESFTQERERLERLREQLVTLGGFWDKEGYDSAELTEALEEELDELREQRDTNNELVQIGMALSIVSHEFEKTVGALRDGFRRMKAWAEANPEMEELYNDMRSSFDHLDGYLTMFTPFDRRLNRTKIDISGKQIRNFLTGLFEARLARHHITLTASETFTKASLNGYSSTFYPVFANLVDNAIFWLQRNLDRPRKIELDAEKSDLIIRDNGPGVSARDRNNIFSLHFSRKPGGRGMGLYVSRETLAKEGYEITLDQNTADRGATFRISPVRRENTASNEG